MTKIKVCEAQYIDAENIERFLMTVKEFEGSIKKNEERELWKWLYQVTPENPPKNVWVGKNKESGKISAHYGMACVKYIINEEVVDAGMICKLAIDEELRQTPTFIQLTQKILRNYPKKGFSFATGLANRSGLLEFHKAFKFSDMGVIPIYAKPFSILGVIKSIIPNFLFIPLSPFIFLIDLIFKCLLILRTLLYSNTYKTVKITGLDESLKVINNFMGKSAKCFPEKSPKNIHQRFQTSPTKKYQVYKSVDHDYNVVGYMACRLMNIRGMKVLIIADLVHDIAKPAALASLLKQIDIIAISNKCALSTFLTNSEVIKKQLFLSLFIKSPESFNLVIHTKKENKYLTKIPLNEWYITWFEHDYA